jgi:hypothetical protein
MSAAGAPQWTKRNPAACFAASSAAAARRDAVGKQASSTTERPAESALRSRQDSRVDELADLAGPGQLVSAGRWIEQQAPHAIP